MGLQNYVDFFNRRDYLAVLQRTLEMSLLTTLITLFIGYPAAYTIARAGKWRNA